MVGQLKLDSKRHIFEKLFMAIFFIFRIFARNPTRLMPRRNTSPIALIRDIWDLNQRITSNKPIYWLKGYGFKVVCIAKVLRYRKRIYIKKTGRKYGHKKLLSKNRQLNYQKAKRT